MSRRVCHVQRAHFLGSWEHEAQQTLKLLKALPAEQYDFRPDKGGRSLGELAWHLAEIDAFIADAVVTGRADFAQKIPGLERPRTVGELAPGYERVHQAWAAKVAAMKPEDLEKPVEFLGRKIRGGDLLWNGVLHHLIHHRGQLVLMCRLAGGTPPGLQGPNREEMAAMQAARG